MTPNCEIGCAGFEDELPLLALGCLTGRERATVLRHVESCASCASELESYSTGLDALMTVLPPVDPPAGLAERVVERVRAEESGRRAPSGRRRPVLAVAAVLVALGIGVGTFVATRDTAGPTVAVGTLHSVSGVASAVSGRVVLTSAWGGRLEMQLDGGPTTSPVTCVVTLADGRRRTVGTFWLHDGYGTWTTGLPAPVSGVRAVSIEDAGGRTIAATRLL